MGRSLKQSMEGTAGESDVTAFAGQIPPRNQALELG